MPPRIKDTGGGGSSTSSSTSSEEQDDTNPESGTARTSSTRLDAPGGTDYGEPGGGDVIHNSPTDGRDNDVTNSGGTSGSGPSSTGSSSSGGSSFTRLDAPGGTDYGESGGGDVIHNSPTDGRDNDVTNSHRTTRTGSSSTGGSSFTRLDAPGGTDYGEPGGGDVIRNSGTDKTRTSGPGATGPQEYGGGFKNEPTEMTESPRAAPTPPPIGVEDETTSGIHGLEEDDNLWARGTQIGFSVKDMEQQVKQKYPDIYKDPDLWGVTYDKKKGKLQVQFDQKGIAKKQAQHLESQVLDNNKDAGLTKDDVYVTNENKNGEDRLVTHLSEEGKRKVQAQQIKEDTGAVDVTFGTDGNGNQTAAPEFGEQPDELSTPNGRYRLKHSGENQGLEYGTDKYWKQYFKSQYERSHPNQHVRNVTLNKKENGGISARIKTGPTRQQQRQAIKDALSTNGEFVKSGSNLRLRGGLSPSDIKVIDKTPGALAGPGAKRRVDAPKHHDTVGFDVGYSNQYKKQRAKNLQEYLGNDANVTINDNGQISVRQNKTGDKRSGDGGENGDLLGGVSHAVQHPLSTVGNAKNGLEHDINNLTQESANQVTPHAFLSIGDNSEAYKARAKKEKVLANRAGEGFNDLLNLRAPSKAEAGALLFQSGELGERGLGDIGKAIENNPLQGTGPKIGGESLGSVPGNVAGAIFGGVGAGIGASTQYIPSASGDGIPFVTKRDEDLTTNGKTPSEIVGTGGILKNVGGSQIQMVKDRPLTTAALFALPAAEGVTEFAGGLSEGSADVTVPYSAGSGITDASGEQGGLSEFETSPEAPTSQAVSEVRTRAANQPDAVKDALDTESINYHTTGDELGSDLTVGGGSSELPGLWTAPDANSVGLRSTSFGSNARNYLSGFKPGLPDLSIGSDRIAAFDANRIEGMPETAQGSGYEVRGAEGEVIERGLGRGEAKSVASDIDGAEVAPDQTTGGYKFLTEDAEPGTAYVRPTGSRTPELEAIYGPKSQFEQVTPKRSVNVRIGGESLDIPFTEKTIEYGGETLPMDFYRGVDAESLAGETTEPSATTTAENIKGEYTTASEASGPGTTSVGSYGAAFGSAWLLGQGDSYSKSSNREDSEDLFNTGSGHPRDTMSNQSFSDEVYGGSSSTEDLLSTESNSPPTTTMSNTGVGGASYLLSPSGSSSIGTSLSSSGRRPSPSGSSPESFPEDRNRRKLKGNNDDYDWGGIDFQKIGDNRLFGSGIADAEDLLNG